MKLFGTDGVRGLTNRQPMDSETALKLGRAAAYCLKNGAHRHRIVIGKDTRLSGYMLETALASGIVSAGTDVMLVGPLPTPGVAFITQSMRADAGIVISGSHNDYRDNGIKFFDRHGFKLSEAQEKKIEEVFHSGKADEAKTTPEKLGKAIRIEDAAGRYVQFLKSTFPHDKTLDGINVVVDCSNGAGYQVAPAVLEELGANVHPIANKPDGMNINLHCGSLHTERLCRVVKEIGADCGIALDGDADRVIMCDEKGEVVDGDAILALCAKYLLKAKKLKKSTVVATVMSNLALDHKMKELGISVVRTAVGDRHVVQAMRDGGYNVGGEQSGHMIFLDHNTTGDGMVGGLQVLAIMLEENKPLSELKKIFTPYPQILLNVLVKEKKDFQQIPEIFSAIEQAQQELNGKGRVVVRYSGTENIVRIMVEGDDSSRINNLAHNIETLFQSRLGAQ
ncbi:MAG: phosphoglucosamine mutase [Deltaproteobacteria bacterium]|nr:phosphoglucosamine mutase [Deltaproteobacteria bacterium]